MLFFEEFFKSMFDLSRSSSITIDYFSRVDSDRSGSISSNELQAALSNGTWSPFNPVGFLFPSILNLLFFHRRKRFEWWLVSGRTRWITNMRRLCWEMSTRKMFSGMFDKDSTSTIDFDEFKSLWQFITQWEKVFRGFDEDQSGTIDKSEFRKALTSFGNDPRNRKKQISIAEWINICILIDKIAFSFDQEIFSLSTGMFDRDGSSTIDFQEFQALWRYVTEWEKCFRSVLISSHTSFIFISLFQKIRFGWKWYNR